MQGMVVQIWMNLLYILLLKRKGWSQNRWLHWPHLWRDQCPHVHLKSSSGNQGSAGVRPQMTVSIWCFRWKNEMGSWEYSLLAMTCGTATAVSDLSESRNCIFFFFFSLFSGWAIKRNSPSDFIKSQRKVCCCHLLSHENLHIYCLQMTAEKLRTEWLIHSCYKSSVCVSKNASWHSEKWNFLHIFVDTTIR